MKASFLSVALLAASTLASQAALVWTVGLDGDGWPTADGIGGGAATDFIQEAGGINALPGSPITTGTAQGTTDNDYYFAGTYSTAASGYSYTPVGMVAADETGWERAFAGNDLDLRVHFTLPATFSSSDLATISFSAENLHDVGANTRFGIEVWMNNILVRTEELIQPADLNVTYTTAPFSLGSVNAGLNGTTDNIVSLRGISYNGASPSGGNWMGIDYVSMDVTPVPEPGSAGLLLGVIGLAVIRRRRTSI